MILRTATIDGQRIRLATEQDFEDFKTRVLQAVRTGGALLELPTLGWQLTNTILITSGTRVSFESRTIDDDDVAETEVAAFISGHLGL